MSEEKVQYETGMNSRYQTHSDIFEEFLKRTGIDISKIENWVAYGGSGSVRLCISLNGGGSIIYHHEES